MVRVGIKLAFLTLGLLAFFIAGIRTEEDEKETDFSYRKGPRGPENWGNLREEWRVCGTGKQQSPVDVADGHAQLDPSLTLLRHYSPADATLEKGGHDIVLSWPAGAGSIQIDGKQYRLNECHWHHPSEHTLDGKRFDLEMHMVHQSDDGAIAVVGILYTYGEPEPFLAKFAKQLQSETEEEAVGKVDPMEIDVGSAKYYRFFGSLTTPPCTEGVVWTIVGRVKSVSRKQVELLQDAVDDDSRMNARPLQPLNGRTVKVLDTRPKSHI